LPHAPQFNGSDASNAHVVPQAVVPPGHPHADERHTCVAAHALSQPPQLRGSAVVSTHASPQAVNGGVHAATHLPAWQKGATREHALPQAPQFPGSVASSLHALTQTASPCGQVQVPAAHVAVDGQVSPHLPQFLGSLDSSTQAEPHVVSPTAHAGWQDPFEHASPAEQT
jgi:hypothetical protein